MDRTGGRLEVELVEDDLDPLDVLPAPELRPLAARVPRPARWALAGLALVAVGATSLTGHLDDRAAAARLADVAGLSVPLDRPLRQTWRTPGEAVESVVGGTVVTVAADGRAVSGVDLTTGAVRWTGTGSCRAVPVGDEREGDVPGGPADGSRASPATPVAQVSVGAAGLEDRPDDLVLCVDALRTGGPDGGHRHPLAARVIDPATGTVVRTIDLGGLAALGLLGSDLVVVGIGPDVHAEAARWSLLTGERRWAYRSPGVVPPGSRWGASFDPAVVQLDIGPWTLTLDADTGERTAPLAFGAGRLPASTAVRLPDGATATTRFRREGGTRTVVRGADGAERLTVRGRLLVPAVDDGTAPDRLYVVRGDGTDGPEVVGVDAASGATRWRSPAPVREVAVVAGVLLVHGDAGLTALDAGTGERVWSAVPAEGEAPARGMATDGRYVLTLEGTPRALVTRDVRTGATAWSALLGVDDASLGVLPDGTVVATGSTEIAALRP